MKGGMRNSYKILVKKPGWKRPLGRHRHRWGTILKWMLKKQEGILWTGFMWLNICLWQDFSEYAYYPLGSMKSAKFLDYMSSYYLIEKDYTPWG
jgi:hypothetical protein